MYFNPAAVLALFSTIIGNPETDDLSNTPAVLPIAADSPLALAEVEPSRPRGGDRHSKHRHPHRKKRAMTIWQTETVLYTLPAPQAYTPSSTPSLPSTTLATTTSIPTSNAEVATTSSAAVQAATSAKSSTAVEAASSASSTTQADTAAITGSATNGPKKVFAHFMMGNAYPMGVSDFASDIAAAQAAGIDGFALNVGPDSWIPDRVASIYEAALGTSFVLFISLDMAVMASDSISDLVPFIDEYSSHPNQYFYNDKQFVSTFAGETITFGLADVAAGWTSFKDTLAAAGIDIFFVPSFTALGPSAAMTMSSNDGAFSWDAWPTTDSEMTTTEDDAYMADRNGKVYMAGVSPWFFTHFSYKNWIYKSDDLFTARWEELVSLQPDFIEIITWNDYGESSYIGPLDGAFPYDSEIQSSEWCTGFDHTAWISLASYYIQAYKNAAYPAITSNSLYWWYRSHPKNAVASVDPYGEPTNYEWADDNIYLTLMLTGAATVTVTSGGDAQTFYGVAGMNHFQYVGFQAGTPSVTITMGGSTVLTVDGPLAITESPTIYNFNPVVATSSF